MWSPSYFAESADGAPNEMYRCLEILDFQAAGQTHSLRSTLSSVDSSDYHR